MKKTILIALIFLSQLTNSQIIVLTTEGKTHFAKSTTIDTLGRIELQTNSKKPKFIDTTEVFALIQGTDTTFLYSNTSYPLDKAKYFVLGQQAGYAYRNPALYTVAVLTGFSIPIGLKAANLYSFLSPIVGGIFVVSTSHIGEKQIPQQMLDNPDFIRGYKLSASRKKIRNLTIYTTAGMVGGIVLTYLVVK